MKTFILFISLFLLCATVYTQTLPTGFNSTNAVPGVTWQQPVGAVFSKSGNQLFVWEKAGRVYVCTRNVDGDYIRQDNPVLDIAEEVGNYHDYGLLGFALDPQFESNGFIYASYVVDRHYLLYHGTPSYNPATTVEYEATIGRITRYHTLTSGGIVSFDPDPASKTILLGDTKKSGLPILYASHGMGSLAFASDGTLLASMGDGASFSGADVGPGSDSYYAQALADSIIRPDENVGAWRSQMHTSLSGKLLRINATTGAGINSNPFYDEFAPFSTKSKIWALGFRNPFRFSIKPGQGSSNPSDGHIGEIFVGDVGFYLWEELNVVKTKGMNFGWPQYEGLGISEAYKVDHTENKEVPIPEAYPCGTREYARFSELIRQDNDSGDRRVYYPCYGFQTPVPVVMSNEKHNIHGRPVLDWVHSDQNLGPNARVGVFDAAGAASAASINTTASGVSGALFNGNASTGGIWYTGSSFPSEYTNTFLLADYGGRWIKRVTFDITDKVTRVDAFASNIGTVVCMAENPIDGSVVYVDYGDGSLDPGSVNKIVFGGNMPPVAKITSNIYYSGDESMTVNFNGTGSYDPDGTIATYAWDFGDPTSANNTSTSSTPTHIFTNADPKKYTVKLTVTDDDGKSTVEQFIVSVSNTPPVVNITSPIDGYKYRVGGGDTTFILTASVSDAEHLPSELSYEWQTILIHSNHTHAEPTNNNPSTSVIIQQIGCTGVDYHYLMRLKVTDGAGLSAIDSSQVYPNCAGALPIFLHTFSVTQSGAANLVKWTTELESNIEYFEVERSSDGINFSTINRQDASNAPGPNHYSFADNRFLPGFNYYRLKIVERGSVIKYSVVVRTVAEGEANIIKVVPNPVVGNFSLTYLSQEKDRITIQIRDISGRLLHTLKENVNKGQNVIYMQNLPTWNSGVYFISVQNKDEVKQVKFIKAR